MRTFVFSFLFIVSSTLAFGQSVTITEGAESVALNISLSYQSNWSTEDINKAIDPNNGGIQHLFNDPITLRKQAPNRFSVSSTTSMGPLSMDFNSKLDYSKVTRGNSTVHTFRFYDFDRLFKSTTITATVTPGANLTSVSVQNNGIIKKDSYQKLKKVPMGVSTFKSRIVKNVKKFRSSTGGN